MAKTSFARANPPQRVPSAPPPPASCAGDGMALAREQARCYLPDLVRLLAAIALSETSEAGVHTRMMSAKQIVEIAGVIPQPTPAPPLYEGAADGGAEADGGEPA